MPRVSLRTGSTLLSSRTKARMHTCAHNLPADLINNNYTFTLTGSAVIPALRNRSRLHHLYLPELPKSLSPSSSRLFVVFAFYKVLFQISTILFVLLFRLKHTPQFILLQVPSFPFSLSFFISNQTLQGNRILPAFPLYP